nr:MAG TPA: hypothetical protein [Caudoviricetes sp.]
MKKQEIKGWAAYLGIIAMGIIGLMLLLGDPLETASNGEVLLCVAMKPLGALIGWFAMRLMDKAIEKGIFPDSVLRWANPKNDKEG